MKLNQVIALIQGLKTAAIKKKADLYKVAQKGGLFEGLTRTYQPVNDGDFVYPSESQRVTMTAQGLIDGFSEALSEFLNIAATQDWGNTQAKADIVVNDKTILEGVPVPHLLFLEKQIVDLQAFVSAIPTLPVDKDWKYDANRGTYVSDPRQTTKTKKVTQFVVVYDATPEHPADVRDVSNDIVEGTWSLLEFSGALPKDEVDLVLKRVEELRKAVLKAREDANGMTVAVKKTAPALLGYVFGDRYNGERAQA